MRRLLAAAGVVSLLASGVAARGESGGARATLSFKVRLIQEATYRTPHPPTGDENDVFSTTLRLFAIGPLFGKPDQAFLGTMAFSYTLHGACSSGGAGCTGTTNLTTFTKLPGGTITAGGSAVSLEHRPYVVRIRGGTGAFAGAAGTIAIAPSGFAEDVFKVRLP